MSGHDTILGHLVGWGLSQRYEDAATEGLAFMLRRHEKLRQRFVALLREAQPDLPGSLHFTTQSLFTTCRPDMCGRTDDKVPVFVENKFWAALTENQPVAYLDRLTEQSVPSLLLFIAPERRRASLWRELLERLTTGKIAHQEVSSQLVEIIGKPYSQRLQVLGWTALFRALEGSDDHARANLEQLAGVCHAADAADSMPLVQEELTDIKLPARLMQYTDIVREVVETGCVDVFHAASSNRHTCWWHGYGQRIQFNWDPALSAWLGVDLVNWRKYEEGPIWLHFSGQFGQTWNVEARLRAWAEDHGRILREDKEGLMLHLPLRAGQERHCVIADLIAQLRVIGETLRMIPTLTAQ